VGQTRKYSLRANDVRCCPDSRHVATAAPCPFSADIVAKVEIRTTLKISRKSIFGLPCSCFGYQCPYGDLWSILDEAIRSLTSLRVKRTSGSKNFPSTPQKDFCNNICHKRKSSVQHIVGWDPRAGRVLIREDPLREMNPYSSRTSPYPAYGRADAHPIVLRWVLAPASF
jgi:hypothetical protein